MLSAAERRIYRVWRGRQLALTFLGYAIFYFVRKNIAVALPLLEKELHITKARLGAYLTGHDVVYGVSKFANGVLGDRSNPRWFMAAGLAASALINGWVGLASTAGLIGGLWVANGWFQGMGFPPCAHILAHWFAPQERGRAWGIWNTSHMVGGAGILVLAGFLGKHLGWRACFMVPGIIGFAIAGVLAWLLRGTPGSLGLPPVEDYLGLDPATQQPEDPVAFRKLAAERVFKNPYVWAVSIGNFFVYLVRMGFFNWATTYFHEVKRIPLDQAAAWTAGFEIAGLVGSLAAGWITDRFFASRRGPTCVAFMVATALSILLFWKMPPGHPVWGGVTLVAIGFFIYGPQFLVGIWVTDLSSKHTAGTAIGLTSIFGYLSSLVSGWGLGAMLDHYGWDGGFAVLLGAAVVGTIPFAFAWRARAVKRAT